MTIYNEIRASPRVTRKKSVILDGIQVAGGVVSSDIYRRVVSSRGSSSGCFNLILCALEARYR